MTWVIENQRLGMGLCLGLRWEEELSSYWISDRSTYSKTTRGSEQRLNNWQARLFVMEQLHLAYHCPLHLVSPASACYSPHTVTAGHLLVGDS